MKNKRTKLFSKAIFASGIIAFALFLAETSASACTILFLDQPEMPEALIQQD